MTPRRRPFERVASSPQGDSARVAELKDFRKSLDPFRLAKIIDQKLERIYKLANRRLSPKPMTENQIIASRREKAVGKPLRGNPTTGFPLRLGIPHNPRDSHFPTATTAARLPLRLHLKWRDNPGYGYILKWLDTGSLLKQVKGVGTLIALITC